MKLFYSGKENFVRRLTTTNSRNNTLTIYVIITAKRGKRTITSLGTATRSSIR